MTSCNQRCYDVCAGPPRDATFQSLASNKSTVQCFTACSGTGADIVPSQQVGNNVEFFVASATHDPPGNDSNSGTRDSPVLTVQRGFELLRSSGYNETGTVVLLNDGDDTAAAVPTVFQIDDFTAINIQPPQAGRQDTPMVLRSDNRIPQTASVPTFLASVTDPFSDLFTFTLGGTGSTGLFPGYALEWDGQIVTVAVVDPAGPDTVELTTGPSISGGGVLTLPAVGQELTVTRPGAEVRTTAFLRWIGTGNNVGFQDIVFGCGPPAVAPGFGVMTFSSIIGYYVNCVFHLPDGGVPGNTHFKFPVDLTVFSGAGAVQFSAIPTWTGYNSGISFLGYALGTVPPPGVIDNPLTLNPVFVRYRLDNILFDGARLTVESNSTMDFEGFVWNRFSETQRIQNNSVITFSKIHIYGALDGDSGFDVDCSTLHFEDVLVDAPTVILTSPGFISAFDSSIIIDGSTSFDFTPGPAQTQPIVIGTDTSDLVIDIGGVFSNDTGPVVQVTRRSSATVSSTVLPTVSVGSFIGAAVGAIGTSISDVPPQGAVAAAGDGSIMTFT